MKVNLTKSILFVLLAMIMLIALIGCQSQSASTATSTSSNSAVSTQISSTSSTNSSTNTATPSQLSGKEISVFAGSASKPALDEAAKIFEKQTGVKVYLTYGGSGTVLSQMELSKTGDIYIPGSPDYMVKSNNKKITDPDSAKIIAYLVPAINIQTGNPKNIQSLSDLTKPGIRVGIGNPNSVCVGLYAVEILDNNHLLTEVYKNIVTQASSCDNTATLISLKSVDAVMGWSVFHDWDPKNIDTIYLKPEQISRLAYIPASISNFAKEKEAAAAFISFLISPTGQEIFTKWGYDVTEAAVRKYAPNAQIGGEYSLPANYPPSVK
jgi:molybdate transport system substrate-binding protein